MRFSYYQRICHPPRVPKIWSNDMGKIKMCYSIHDSKTGYFTKYKNISIEMDLPTNEYGFILFDDCFALCVEKAKSIINQPFRPINFTILEN